MKKGSVSPERIIELLNEKGIVLTSEQSEQLLKYNTGPSNLLFGLGRQVIQGYRVTVEYDRITEEEMCIKKTIVARIVCLAISKSKK